MLFGYIEPYFAAGHGAHGQALRTQFHQLTHTVKNDLNDVGNGFGLEGAAVAGVF